MKRITKLCIIFVSIFISSNLFILNVLAKDIYYRDTYIDKFEAKCVEKNLTTAGMAECEYKVYDMWDKELNKYYNLLMK